MNSQLQPTDYIPNPDFYFWYIIAALLGMFALFVIGKWYGSVEKRFEKNDERQKINDEKFNEFIKTQNQHTSEIERHTKSIDNIMHEQTAALTKQTDVLIQLLRHYNESE